MAELVSRQAKKAMIVRQWRGLAKKEKEAIYVAHFREDILPKLRQLSGFVGASVLRTERKDGIEVTVLTRWQSVEAIRAFAGTKLEVAVVAEEAKACFHSYDKTVTHRAVVLEEKA